MDIVEIVKWGALLVVVGILAVIPLRLLQYIVLRLSAPLRWR